jgi:hypothetical protein
VNHPWGLTQGRRLGWRPARKILGRCVVFKWDNIVTRSVYSIVDHCEFGMRGKRPPNEYQRLDEGVVFIVIA